MLGRIRKAVAAQAPDPLAEARAAGFLGYAGFGTIYGELTAELPFNHCDAQIFGAVRVGAFTYCNYGGEIRDATIGRYCSIGQRAIIGPGRTRSVASPPIRS